MAAGCGLSMRASGECVRVILESGLLAVLDADALNLIAQDASLRKLLHSHCALTPHPGEAARLNGGMLPTMEAAARLHALGPAVLLKGACSLIAGDGRFLSASGSVGMAKGGSGDALTGIVGALLAQGLSPTAALWLGSELHGRAGELAAEEKGTFSMLPTDLIEALPRVFLSLEDLRR